MALGLGVLLEELHDDVTSSGRELVRARVDERHHGRAQFRRIAEGPGGIEHRAAVSVEGEDDRCGIRPSLRRGVNQSLPDDVVHGPLPATQGVGGVGGAGSQQPGEAKEDEAEDGALRAAIAVRTATRVFLGIVAG